MFQQGDRAQTSYPKLRRTTKLSPGAVLDSICSPYPSASPSGPVWGTPELWFNDSNSHVADFEGCVGLMGISVEYSRRRFVESQNR